MTQQPIAICIATPLHWAMQAFGAASLVWILKQHLHSLKEAFCCHATACPLCLTCCGNFLQRQIHVAMSVPATGLMQAKGEAIAAHQVTGLTKQAVLLKFLPIFLPTFMQPKTAVETLLVKHWPLLLRLHNCTQLLMPGQACCHCFVTKHQHYRPFSTAAETTWTGSAPCVAHTSRTAVSCCGRQCCSVMTTTTSCCYVTA